MPNHFETQVDHYKAQVDRFKIQDFTHADGRLAWCVVDNKQVGSDGEHFWVGPYEDKETAEHVLDALVSSWGNMVPVGHPDAEWQ